MASSNLRILHSRTSAVSRKSPRRNNPRFRYLDFLEERCLFSGNPPVVSNILSTTLHDRTTLLPLSSFTAAYSDPESDPLASIKILSLPAHGTLFINITPVDSSMIGVAIPVSSLTQRINFYIPNAGFIGTDSFQWTASDGTSFANTPANITITTTDQAPSLSNVTQNIGENFATQLSQFYFSPGFTDPDSGDTLHNLEVVSLPTHGTLTLNGSSVTANETITNANISLLTYTPNNGYLGADSFTWNADDGALFAASPAALNLSVISDAPPSITDGAANLTSNTVKTFAASDFSSHFSDTDIGNTLQSIQILSLPGNGTLALGGVALTAGQIITTSNISNLTYTPTNGFGGLNFFQWTASDGSLVAGSPANFTLTVNFPPPTITDVAKSGSFGTDTQFTAADFTSVFSDVNVNATLQSIKVITLPANGTLELSSVPVIANQTVLAADLSNLTYTANAGGNDSFEFSAFDGVLNSNLANVTIHTDTVPILSNEQTFIFNSDLDLLSAGSATRLTAAAIFSDTDGDTVQSVKITKLTTHGKLLLNGVAISAGQIISPANFANLTYSAGKFVGSDSFTLNISDGTSFAAADATVSIAAVTGLGVVGNSTPVSSKHAATAANFTDFGTWTTAPDVSMQNDTRTYHIVNTSNATINLSNITLSGADAADFSIISSAANTSLAPGQDGDVTIQFLPTAAGKRVANLTIQNSTSATKPVIIELQGTGLVTTTISTVTAGAGGVVQAGATLAGKGAGAANGQILTFTYTASLANGTVVAASSLQPATAKGLTVRLDDDYTDSQPFLTNDQSFNANGVDLNLIAGLEFGLQGIKAGQKSTFVINAAAAYGSSGAPGVPANATLRFDIQAVSILAKPELGVLFPNANATPIALTAGQTAVSANNGTILTVPNGQLSASQAFNLVSVFTDNANGTSLSNVTVSSVKVTGKNAKDFTVTNSNGTLTVTFHPLAAGTRNATISISSSDPVHKTFTFNVQGTSSAFTDLKDTIGTTHFPASVVSGSTTKLSIPVSITNDGNTAIPAGTKVDIQIFAHNTSNSTNTLITTLSNQTVTGIAPGSSKTFTASTTIPGSLANGTYQILATIIDDGAFTELTTTNNSATSTQSFTVT